MALPTLFRARKRKAARYGVALAIFPGNANFAVKIERAPDSGGSPDTANSVFLKVRPGEPVFVDELPAAGDTYHYRGMHTREGHDDSVETSWFALKAVELPEVLPVIPPEPNMALDIWRDPSTGTVYLYVNGSPRVRSVKWAVNVNTSFPAKGTGTAVDTNDDGDVDITTTTSTTTADDDVYATVTFYEEAGGTGAVLGTLRKKITVPAETIYPGLSRSAENETATLGTSGAYVNDPDGVMTKLEYKKKVGSAAWDASWTLKSASPTHATQYTETVALEEDHLSFIEWRWTAVINGQTVYGTLKSSGFDAGKLPNLAIDFAVTDDWDVTPILYGDFDAASGKVDSNHGTSPSTPARATVTAVGSVNLDSDRVANKAAVDAAYGKYPVSLAAGETLKAAAVGYSATGGGGNAGSGLATNEITRPPEDPRLTDVNMNAPPYENAGNTTFYTNWDTVGANTTDHEIRLEHYLDGELVDYEGAVAINATNPRTKVASGYTGYTSGYTRVLLVEKSGGAIIDTKTTDADYVTT